MHDDESDIMNSEINTHTVRTAYSQKTYWKASSACQQNEAPDTVELCGVSGGYPGMCFRLPEQRYAMEKIELLMQTAYSRGEHDNKLAVAKMLKSLIAL